MWQQSFSPPHLACLVDEQQVQQLALFANAEKGQGTRRRRPHTTAPLHCSWLLSATIIATNGSKCYDLNGTQVRTCYNRDDAVVEQLPNTASCRTAELQLSLAASAKLPGTSALMANSEPSLVTDACASPPAPLRWLYSYPQNRYYLLDYTSMWTTLVDEFALRKLSTSR